MKTFAARVSATASPQPTISLWLAIGIACLVLPCLGIFPVEAQPGNSAQNLHGCTASTIPTGSVAKACLDNSVASGGGAFIMCTSSGNFCCEPGSASGCYKLRQSIATSPLVMPTQNELPPRSLVTPIYGATSVAGPKGAVGASPN
jgi:hypothetical protein